MLNMPPQSSLVLSEQKSHIVSQEMNDFASRINEKSIIVKSNNIHSVSCNEKPPPAHKSSQLVSQPSSQVLPLNLEKKMLDILASPYYRFNHNSLSSTDSVTENIPKLKRTWLQRHCQCSDKAKFITGSVMICQKCDGKFYDAPKNQKHKLLKISQCSSYNNNNNNKLKPELHKYLANRTYNTFLQNGPCWQVAPDLQMCRECQHQEKDRTELGIFCRFAAFRRLQYCGDGILKEAGFSLLEQDAKPEDLSIWLPNATKSSYCFNIETAKFLLGCVGAQLCNLTYQELKLLEGKKPYWRRAVKGVREMCDVCQTTIFNSHWVCGCCGFVVCPDCFQSRANDFESNITVCNTKDECKDEYKWLLCYAKVKHEPSKLLLAQIIADDALTQLNEIAHQLSIKLNLPFSCNCECSSLLHLTSNGKKKKTLYKWQKDVEKENYEEQLRFHQQQINSHLRHYLLCDKMNFKLPTSNHFSVSNESKYPFVYSKSLPNHSMTLIQSSILYPKVPHSWLCDGQLLLLHDPCCNYNSGLFQEQWLRGQPVMVTGIQKHLHSSLWTPSAFSKDFGHVRNDLINALSGCVISNQPMKRFWDGFEERRKALKDECGRPMILKLKDWPPSHDFAELLPSRFRDLNRCLPLPEYTKRDGCLNLAARLPDFLVRPDLGPKLYIAYGCARHPSTASTNLHLDISDATNIMVYVCAPKDSNGIQEKHNALLALNEAGCDVLTLRRVRHKNIVPGALWHIYHPSDADKIRDFLNERALKLGHKLESNHDPIHDQSWYLDGPLREELYSKYGVKGYTIAQCLGDAIFIPAGAPHQVRNLHNCIKVAEDFISPENVSHCFKLTEQFRHLSEMHTNHEDKLQIKNVIYHTIRDAASVLLAKDM